MMNEDKVSNLHPKYAEMQRKRDVFAAVESTDAIRKTRETNLPKYPEELGEEYNARLCSSTIDGIVAGGVGVIAGAVFYEEIDTSGVTLDAEILENIDNQGNSFNVFCRDAFKAAFDGFSAIVIDTPSLETQPRSLEDQQNLGLRPYWRLYRAKDVINWSFDVDTAKQKRLKMIVFREVVTEMDGRFSHKDVTFYRHWFINDAGQAAWELWREKDKSLLHNAEIELIGQGLIGDMDELPVAIIGDMMDDPWLLVESRLEIKAYQKESSFDVIEYLSIPTFYTKGYDGDSRLKLGASAHIKMPVNGEVGFAQIDSSGLAELKATITQIKDTIRAKVNEMVSISTEGGFEETATAALIKDRDKQARIIVWADQLKDALERALQFTGQLLGKGEDGAGEIVLRTKWAIAEEKAAEMNQIVTDEDHKDDK